MKIAILSDIHANIEAFLAVLKDCALEEVANIVVAGDLIGYYYWPKEVVEIIMKDNRFTCIRGNHEDILVESLRCEIAAERYRKKYGSGYDVCKKTLSSDQLLWLTKLPVSAELVINGIHFSVHHGSPTSTDEYIYPDSAEDVFARCSVARDFTILGHTHFPFIYCKGGRTLLNPGSVGQPRDFGGQACYTVINLTNKSIRFKRVPFDTSVVIAAARERDPELTYLQTIMTRGVK